MAIVTHLLVSNLVTCSCGTPSNGSAERRWEYASNSCNGDTIQYVAIVMVAQYIIAVS